MTSPPGNDPPLDPVVIQEASNWEAGDRRATPRWLAWLVAIPSAGILLLPTAAAMARDDPAYDVGYASGGALFALFLALIVRAVYVRARGRAWRSAISPWLLPVAVLCLLASSAIGVGPELIASRQRIQSMETPLPADYLDIGRPYELTRLSPEEEAALEAEMEATLREAKATGVETRYVELDGQTIGAVMVMGVEPEVAAEPGYFDDVLRGAEQAGAHASFGDLQGQRVIWARLPDEGEFVIWQYEALVVSVFAVDRATTEEIASQLMAAN
jgi:hypothetical protein